MRSSKWWLCVAVLAVLAGVALAACGSSGGSSSSETTESAESGSSEEGDETTASSTSGSPFEVLAILDNSGATKVYGQIQEAAMKGTAAYLNENGGILGHPVEVTVLNDNGDPETASAELVKYMGEGNAPNMVFPGTSAIDSAAVLPLLKKFNLLGIGTVLGAGCRENAQSICPTGFLPEAGYAGSLPAIAEFMKKEGWTNVGILLEEGPLAEDQLSKTGILPYMEEEGIKTTVVKFPPKTVDLKPQVSQLQSEGVDAIYTDSFVPSPGYVAKARSELGLVSKLPLVYGPVSAAGDLTELMSAAEYKNAFEDTYAVNLKSENSPAREAMIKSAEPFGGITSQPVNLGAYPWTDLILAREVAKQVNSIETEPMLEGMEHLEGEAADNPNYILGHPIEFTEENHENNAPGQEKFHPVVPVAPLVDGILQSE